jgi:uncharacterized protein involved in outer membrane biogenesis
MGWLPFEYAVRNLGRAPTRTVGTIAGHVLVVGLVLAAVEFCAWNGAKSDREQQSAECDFARGWE